MHNLFLGTAKRMLEIWLDENKLDIGDLQAVQNLVDQTQVPSYILVDCHLELQGHSLVSLRSNGNRGRVCFRSLLCITS